jgi:putative ABC transport system permease protein
MLALGGSIIGAGGAIASGKLLTTLLYQVDARDPLRLAATAMLMIVVAVCASAIPARRASRQDPARTLRAE